MQGLRHCSPRKVAFTLAEVLITLGIIGIVAAMTLPGLIAKYQEKQWRVAYKKAYSILGQAVLRLQADGDYLSPYDDYFIGNLPENLGVYYSPNFGKNFKTISKYFKATKTCFDYNADECWYCNGEAGLYDSTPPLYLGCTRGSYAFVDASGMAWYMFHNNEARILVDVNGDQGPNKLAHDRYCLYISGADSQSGWSRNIDRAIPVEDVISKGRWCPEGNCLYKTWLLK